MSSNVAKTAVELAKREAARAAVDQYVAVSYFVLWKSSEGLIN